MKYNHANRPTLPVKPSPPLPQPAPKPGPPLPPPTGRGSAHGRASSPSAWSHRLPAAGLAAAGLAVSTYLALYQWHVVHSVWEPFFGEGSRRILRESWFAHLFPVPDAFLGALGYLVDLLALSVGPTDRWRAMPWIILILGATVVGMGLVGIMLTIFQPVFFNAWCTLCLTSAGISLVIAIWSYPEVAATLGHLTQQKDSGHSLWRSALGIEQR